MKTHMRQRRDYGFALGLAAGTLVGAGLTLWLAPRLASEVRERITDSAKNIGQRASGHFEDVSTRVGDFVEVLTRPRAL